MDRLTKRKGVRPSKSNEVSWNILVPKTGGKRILIHIPSNDIYILQIELPEGQVSVDGDHWGQVDSYKNRLALGSIDITDIDATYIKVGEEPMRSGGVRGVGWRPN